MLLNFLNDLRLLHRLEQAHVTIDDLTRQFVALISLLKQLLEPLHVFLLIGVEAFLQGSLFHLLVSILLLTDFRRVPARDVFVREFFLEHILQDLKIVLHLLLRLLFDILWWLIDDVLDMVLLDEDLRRHQTHCFLNLLQIIDDLFMEEAQFHRRTLLRQYILHRRLDRILVRQRHDSIAALRR